MKKPPLAKRKYHYIYKITRFDGKYYIGMHSTDDLDDGYFGSGSRLFHSVRYYGKDKHNKEILEMCNSRQEAIEKEKLLVNEETLKDPLCLNLTVGGAYISRAPEDPSSSERRRQALIDFYNSENGAKAKQKLSELHKDRKATAEAKLNMSVAAKKRMQRMQEDGSWEEVKKKNAMRHVGKVQSPETRVKRGVAIRKRKELFGPRKFSEEARKNISLSLIGSARNAKKWIIICATTRDTLVVENLQKWLKDTGLVRTRDGKGAKIKYSKDILFNIQPAAKEREAV